MSEAWTYRRLWSEIRMYLADLLLVAALRVAPTDHPESVKLARMAAIYARDVIQTTNPPGPGSER